MGNYLAGKLKKAIPLIFRETRSPFQLVEISNLSIFAEREYQEVV
jgi:hypothetical protein